MIPDGWQAMPFAELADYKAGRTPARANTDYWQGADHGVPWVAISDMAEFGTVVTTKEKVSRAAFRDVFRGKIVPAGTLIMSFKLTIGRVATLGVDACHNEAIIAIYPRKSVDQRFLGYFLAQVEYDTLQDRQVKGNTLNQEKIDRIEIWLPPNDEPKQIADVLDLVRHAIELQDDGLVAAQELKRVAMRALFKNGLLGEAQKETDIGPVPESWLSPALEEVAHLSTGTTPSTKRADFYEGTVPFIKTAEIVNNRINGSSTFVSDEAITRYNLRIYPPGTIFMAMYGQGKTRGQVALLDVPATTSQNAAAIETNERMLPEFLWHYFLSRYEYLRGIGSLGHLSHLNLGYLRELHVPLPPTVDEQRDIVAILDAIDRKTDLHRRKRAVLDQLFKALLHKLMTGEIRVSDLDVSALNPKPSAEVAA